MILFVFVVHFGCMISYIACETRFPPKALLGGMRDVVLFAISLINRLVQTESVIYYFLVYFVFPHSDNFTNTLSNAPS